MKPRHVFPAALCATLLIGTALTAESAGARNITYQLDIPAQNLNDALQALALASQHKLLYSSELVDGKSAPALKGIYTTEQAVSQLLTGTGLTYEVSEGLVLIRSKDGKAPLTSQAKNPSNLESADGPSVADAARSGEGVRLAQSDTSSQDPNAAGDQASAPSLEEVIVTAQKRSTMLRDTPMSLTVLGREELERRSLISAVDYLSTVPGVHLDSFGLGDNQLTIRGLGLTTGQSPTAGAYLGDVPLTDALDFSMIDVKLVDMERVEVLRGPQGTLYGSGALGGAVREIPAAPSLTDSEASFKIGYASTSGSADPSYNAVGVFNLPLINDKMALRVSAYHFKKAGFIDNISTPTIEALSAATQVPVLLEKDAGGHEYTGVRASTLFQPADRLDLTLLLGYQKLHQNGRSELNMSAGNYVDAALNTTDEFQEQTFKFANLVADFDLSWSKLTSATSFTRLDSGFDFSHSRVIPSASNVPDEIAKKGFFQELRLATNFAGPFQFVTGAYYEDIKRNEDVAVEWASPNIAALQAFWGTTDPDIYRSLVHADLKQHALFGELSYKPVDQLTLKAGTRWFDYERHDSSVTYFGIAPGLDPAVSLTGDLPTKEDGNVYKLGVDYKPTDNALVYLLWSQGFRLGQTTDNTAVFQLFRDVCDKNQDGLIDGSQFPFSEKITLKSDSLDNYELGGKFGLLSGRLSINAAAYRINWQDLPVSTTIAVDGLGCNASFNGGEAKSQGVEFEAALRATENLQVNVSGSITDTAYLDDLTGKKGDRLPFSPRNNASIGLQYNFELAGRRTFVRSDFAYVGRSATDHNPPDRVFTDAYRKVDFRAGIAFDKVNVELYGTNLTNEDAVIGVFNLDRGWRLEPRIVGLEINVDF